MRTNVASILAGLVLLLVTTQSASAAHRDIDAKGVSEVLLNTTHASVKFESWDKQLVRIEASTQAAADGLEVERRGSALEMTTPGSLKGKNTKESREKMKEFKGRMKVWKKEMKAWKKQMRDAKGEGGDMPPMPEVPAIDYSNATNGHVDSLTITVPRDFTIRARTVSGSLQVDGGSGQARMQTVSGNVTVNGFSGALLARAVSGEVTVTGAEGDIQAKVVSGTVLLKDVRGKISASAVSGEIRLEGVKSKEIQAKTQSGALEFVGALAKGGVYSFKSHSGEVSLKLPKDARFHYKIKSMSGSTEGKPFGVEGSGKLKGQTGGAGDDDPVLRVKTFSGSVELEAL